MRHPPSLFLDNQAFLAWGLPFESRLFVAESITVPLNPKNYDPQKALLVDRPPVGERWIHELKLDGFRMGLFLNGRGARLISRRGTEYTAAFPEIVAAARTLKARNAVIDGEVVVLDATGVSRFQLLQQLGSSRRGLTFFTFDLLSLDGRDLMLLPLESRKRQLRALVGTRPTTIRYTPHFDAPGPEVLARACELGAEGIVSKRRDAPYRPGSRNSDWQKAKCTKRQEFVIGGFTDPEGSRVGVGSLLIGYYERDLLRFAGKVGTGRGWSDAFGRRLRKRLEGIEVPASPFDPSPRGWLGKHAHWVQPKLVGEVEFTEWTGDGSVRHPSLQGFRGDKRARDVVRERAVQLPTAARTRARSMFPRLGVTTEDLARLYLEIAEWAMPHVERRPLTLVRMRAPITRDDVLRSQAEFVRHTARSQEFVPDVVPRIRIRELKKQGEYCYIDAPAALAALIEAGIVELHAWNARVGDVEHPDRVVFDIDPGDDVPWTAVVAAARRLRRLLEQRDLESWVKTTGGKGLHVVAPFRPEHSWDVVFEFSRSIAALLAEAEPKRYTIAFDTGARAGKLLIDYKRNYRTSIVVAGFSTRARPNAPMSVPVRWEDLSRLGGEQYTVATIREHLRRVRTDPWRGYWTARQRLRL